MPQLAVEVLVAASTCMASPTPSDRFAEVADGLEVGVHRRQDLGHGARLLCNNGDTTDERAERAVDGDEVADHTDEAERGSGDDQAGDDDGDPSDSRHGLSYSVGSNLATEPA